MHKCIPVTSAFDLFAKKLWPADKSTTFSRRCPLSLRLLSSQIWGERHGMAFSASPCAKLERVGRSPCELLGQSHEFDPMFMLKLSLANLVLFPVVVHA